MAARRITDRLIASLKAEQGSRLEILDSEATGLCLRVMPSGVKSWSFLFRAVPGGPKKRLTIGDYPAWSLADARKRALALRKGVQDGVDPVVEKKRTRGELTFAKLLERFIAHAKPRLRSWADYEALLNRNVVPKLGDRRATDVQRTDIANLLDEIAAAAPVTSNRVQAVLSSAFTWATNEGLILANPIVRLSKRAIEKPKERVLSDEEVSRLWRGLDDMAAAYRDALRLVLLTGQRPGECAGIRAEEVDLKDGVWTIPAERAKNKRAHGVPLVGEALAIVRRLKGTTATGALIITPRGAELTPQNLAKAFERLPNGTLGTPATPHDLRRTAATLMARLGIDRFHVAAVLNHSGTTKATVTGAVYDQHSYLPEKKRALEALGAEVARLVAGVEKPINVVAMKRATP